MAGKRLYVDANVFIAMLEQSDERSQLLLQLLTAKYSSGETSFVTSALTLAECLVVPYRRKDAELISAYQQWLGSDAVAAVPISRQILLDAALLRAFHTTLKLPDAIHLATAHSEGCKLLLTEDRRLSTALSDHEELPKSAAPLNLLRPDIDTLKDLIRELLG